MAKRRDQELIRTALRELSLREHPKRPGKWQVIVTSEEVEAIKQDRISDLQIRKQPREESRWVVSLTASEVKAVIEGRLGEGIDSGLLDVEGLPESSPDSKQTESRKSKSHQGLDVAEMSAGPSGVEEDTKARRSSGGSRQTLEENQREHRREVFRNNLRRWLQFQKMSQREAAERLEISPRLLQRWAKDGIAQPSKRTQDSLLVLCKSMGLERIDDLWLSWTPLSTVGGLVTFLEESGQMEKAMKAVSELITRNEDVSSGDSRFDLESVLENTFENGIASVVQVRKALKRLGVDAPNGFDDSGDV